MATAAIRTSSPRPLRRGAELPATLRGLVAARLDVLSHEERAVVEDASVVGLRGELEALTTLATARGASDIVPIVEELAAKDVIAVDGDTWTFRSGLAREVAYEILTKADRARRHHALAWWLSESTQQTDRQHEVVEQLAHHYSEASVLTAEVGAVSGVPDRRVAIGGRVHHHVGGAVTPAGLPSGGGGPAVTGHRRDTPGRGRRPAGRAAGAGRCEGQPA